MSSSCIYVNIVYTPLIANPASVTRLELVTRASVKMLNMPEQDTGDKVK